MSPVTKSLTFTIVLLLGTLGTYNANASWQALPAAQISSKTLGGEILLIQMKHSLVIDGDESAKLLAELGVTMKKSLLNDMIMNKPATSLTEAYGRPDRPATNSVIEKYLNLITVQAPIT